MSSSQSATSNTIPETAISHSTSEIYDRQIRLWGADAQSKISRARVLYIHITGVTSEILKNLVLAGVSATILDPRDFPSSVIDTPTCFFPQPYDTTTCDSKTSVAKAIMPYVMELNPLLKSSCEICEEEVEALPDEFFKRFDIVIASKLSIAQCTRISNVTSQCNNYFCLVDTFGLSGCSIIDFGVNRTYRKEIGKDKLSDILMVDNYISFQQLWSKNVKDAVGRWDKIPPKIWFEYRLLLQYLCDVGCWPSDDDQIEKFVQFCKKYLSEQNCMNISQEYYGTSDDQVQQGLFTLGTLALAQVSPVCAVLGGVIGNEVIKVLSGKGEPANNILLFDGTTGGCRQFLIK